MLESILSKKKETRKYLLDEVFKTNGVPNYTFVKRLNIEETLNRKLKARNCALLFLGYSKSGKTVYRKKYFEDKDYKLVIFRCNKDSTIQNLYNQIVNDLHIPVRREETQTKTLRENCKFCKSLGNENIAKLASEYGEDSENTKSLSSGYLDIAIDVNYICNNINDKDKTVIILEDYHLVSSEFNKRFSEDLKHFIDGEILFIIVGIPSTPDRSFRNNPDLAGHSERIKFDYLSYDEVDNIIEKGEDCLNVKFPKEIKEKIRTYSMCNAYLAQAICYEILYKLNVLETREETFKNFPKDIVEEACRSLSNGKMDSEYSPIVDVILYGSRSQQKGKAYNQYAELLKGIKESPIAKIEKGLTYSDIGKISWESLQPEYIQSFIDKGTYKSETTFKISLNNQISVAMDKLGENFHC